MRIPAPKAERDDVVRVLNYRKRPAVWESGTVLHDPTWTHGAYGRWRYVVRLDRVSDRPNRRGNFRPIDVTVGDDGIRGENGVRRANR